MNWQLFSLVFIILSIAHVIADFMTPYRKLTFKNIWTLLFSEYVLALNPLHGLWDEFSPLKLHPKYLKTEVEERRIKHKGKFIPYRHYNQKITDGKFWRWLAVDQLFHVLSNIALAWLVSVVIV